MNRRKHSKWHGPIREIPYIAPTEQEERLDLVMNTVLWTILGICVFLVLIAQLVMAIRG